MRRSLVLICGVFVAMALPATANATINTAFNNAAVPITCTLQATTNYRVCGGTANTTVPSFDGVPIDVTITFPADAGGSDNNFPMIGLFHGWGGTKIIEANTASNTAKRWVDQGYAVFSMSDRGWGSSCGGPSATPKVAPCTNGYIHLMHNAFEVRDAQYLMGMLADDALINPAQIGVNGGSYGGGISAQLATLKNRTQLANGSKVAWTSPANSTPMSIAAAIPEYTWSDLPSALMPNGSAYDYAAMSPYNGPNGDHRVGVNKSYWNGQLNLAGTVLGYYAPTSPGPDFPDPAADIKNWFTLINTGGPYDGNATADAMVTELSGNHSSYGVDDSATTPAPMLLTSGWNDDLFPASEALRLYNKIRTNHPSAPVKFYGLDYGHQPRSNGANADAAAFAADYAGLVAAGNGWMDHYVKGNGSAPSNAVGGVTVTTSTCSGATRVAGTTYNAPTWAQLAPGEVRFSDATARTIASNTNPSSTFVSGTICADSTSATNTTGSAAYISPAAPSGGYTLAGGAIVDATFTVTGANDQIIGRLYDVDPTGPSVKEKLIARSIYRPLHVGEGAKKQTFQLYQQAWKVETGHQLKLELLSADSPYVQSAANTAQQPIAVSDLTLHVPTIDAPGTGGGFVSDPSVKNLPNGYVFSQDVKDTDTSAPTTTDNVPGSPVNAPVTVTLSATDAGVTGVGSTYYESGAAPADPTTLSNLYDSGNKPVLQNGEKIKYFSVDNAGNQESVKTSLTAQVDTTPPAAPVLISGPPAGNTATSVTVTFTVGGGESSRCSLDGAVASTCTSPVSLTGLSVGSHTLNLYAVDAVGNQSTPLTVAFAVEKPPTLAVKVKTKGKVKVGKTITAAATSSSAGYAVSGVKYSYKWTAGKKKVGTKSKLKLTKSMKGKKISVTVTATKSDYTNGSKTVTVSKKLK